MAQEGKSLRIGINGFGRIGRMVLRASMDRKNIEIVGVNDPFIDPDYMVYQLKYDSAQGRFNGTVTAEVGKGDAPSYLIVNGNKIRVFQERNPAQIKWQDVNAQYVAECTGVFKDASKFKMSADGKTAESIEKAGADAHFGEPGTKNGVQRVLISAPSKSYSNFVMGVNEDKLDLKSKDVCLSNASCTTNCLAPLVKVLNDNFGIAEGLMTTIHATTGNQPAVDAPTRKKGQWALGRSILGNIIPATTGAATAVGKVVPEVNGKLTGMAFRVPTITGSVVDLTVRLEKPVKDVDEINGVFLKASQTTMGKYLGYTAEDLVSSDIIGDPRSSVFNSKSTLLMGNNFVKVVSWYDNEWGYSNRLLDLATYAATKDGILS